MTRSTITALSLVSILATASTSMAGPAPRLDLRLPRVVATAEPAPAEASPTATMLAEPVPASPRRTIFGLPRNVGPVDRVIRTVVGLGLVGLGAYGLASDELSTTTSVVLMGVSAVPLLTAATAYCPLYQAFGIDESF